MIPAYCMKAARETAVMRADTARCGGITARCGGIGVTAHLLMSLGSDFIS
jgi:hypothetical protein